MYVFSQDLGTVHKVCHAFFDDFLLPSPVSQTVTNLGPPLKVCHTSEQKVNKQISGKCRLPLNNFNHYNILNNNKRPYWVFLINPEIPMKV